MKDKIIFRQSLLPIEISLEDDGIYFAECRELDVWSQGETLEEAKMMIKEALEAFFESCQRRGTLAKILEKKMRKLITKESNNGTTTRS